MESCTQTMWSIACLVTITCICSALATPGPEPSQPPEPPDSVSAPSDYDLFYDLIKNHYDTYYDVTMDTILESSESVTLQDIFTEDTDSVTLTALRELAESTYDIITEPTQWVAARVKSAPDVLRSVTMPELMSPLRGHAESTTERTTDSTPQPANNNSLFVLLEADDIPSERDERLAALALCISQLHARNGDVTSSGVLGNLSDDGLVRMCELSLDLRMLDNELLDAITQQVYPRDLNNYVIVLRYLSGQQYLSDLLIAYADLYNDKKLNTHLIKPAAISLAIKVKNVIESTDVSDVLVLNKLNELVKNIEFDLKSFISQSAFKIMSADYSQLQCLDDNAIISEIIEQVYADDSASAANIIGFARSMWHAPQRVHVLVTLSELMAAHGQLDTPASVSLSYIIKQAIQAPNYTNLEPKLKNKIQDIIVQLEPHVKSFVSKSATNINKDEFEYPIEFYIDEIIAEITKEAYANSSANVFNVLNFVHGLPYVSQQAAAYEALYEEMARNQHLDTLLVLSLANYLHSTMDLPAFCLAALDVETMLEELRAKLQPAVSSVTSQSAVNIKNGAFSELIQFDRQDFATFRSYLPTLIGKAYDHNKENIEPILKLIRHLPWIKSHIFGLISIYNEMKINNHLESCEIFKLAYRIKETMSMNSYKKIDQEYKNMLENLKSNLSSIVTLFVWEGAQVCTVRNVAYDEFLFAGSWAHKDASDRRLVYTWMAGGVAVDGAQWRVTPVDEGSWFTVENLHYYNEFLASDDQGHVRTVVSRSYWQLEPHGTSQVVKLRSNGSYLAAHAASNGDALRRDVAMETEFDEWELHCK